MNIQQLIEAQFAKLTIQFLDYMVIPNPDGDILGEEEFTGEIYTVTLASPDGDILVAFDNPQSAESVRVQFLEDTGVGLTSKVMAYYLGDVMDVYDLV